MSKTPKPPSAAPARACELKLLPFPQRVAPPPPAPIYPDDDMEQLVAGIRRLRGLDTSAFMVIRGFTCEQLEKHGVSLETAESELPTFAEALRALAALLDTARMQLGSLADDAGDGA